MVKIKRGEHEIKVTKGAFINMFKPLGYTLVNEKKNEKKPEPVKNDKSVTDEVNNNAEPVKNDKFNKGKGEKQGD